MSTINTILIKRRLESSPLNNVPSLSGGELAFSEKNHTLYYGGQYGTLTIGGSGAFVSLEGNQTVLGDKTLTGSTTLSSLTFSSNSTIDAGSNKITNLGSPASDYDASTKKYVDDEIANLGSSGGSATNALSAEIYGNFVKLTEERPVVLLSSLDVSGSTSIGGDLTVTGNLSVLGDFTQINTEVTTTSAFAITNNGSGPALEVTQTGNEPVAVFYDDTNVALYIDGKSLTPGYVGIGTDTPNEKLTVSGNISANGSIYASGGFQAGDITGTSTLYVENGKVGINTETPNEELTVVGSISASEDIFARNGTLTGFLSTVGAVDFDSTLDVVGAVTLGNTLDVTGATTFASTVSAQGAVTVDGVVTINNNLVVTGTSSLDNGSITTDGAGTITGTSGVSQLVDFIVDGGTF